MARGWRWTGLALVTLGAFGIVTTARVDAPWTSGWLGPATLALLVVGWGLAITGMVKRIRYHRRRMAE